MDPRTFLPPRAIPVAPVPEPGQRAPRLDRPLEGQPVVIAFLRHVGCPFAEATFKALRAQAEGTDAVHFMAVSHAPRDATDRWCSAVAGGPGPVELVIDESRVLYAAWGLGTTSLSHFMGLHSLTAVAGLAREGVRNRHPAGTRWQGAGTFAVDTEGVVRWVHRPAHAGSLPDLALAVAAVRPG